MQDRIDGIMTAIKALQIETDVKSAKNKLYWVDHHLENALTSLKLANKRLVDKNNDLGYHS